jgi:hypothetical protein
MSIKCVMCEKELDYEPEYCCNGEMCGCRGEPIDPPVCSNECSDAFMKEYEKGITKSRIMSDASNVPK